MSTKHNKKKLKVLYDTGIQDPHVLQLETSLSWATVYWTILSIKAGESLEDAKRCKIRCVSDDRRCVTQLANYYSAISAEEIGQKLFERRDVKVSARTIQRSLDKFGLSKVKRKTSQYTKEWCEIQNVRILQWPANSPDLSPIKNI